MAELKLLPCPFCGGAPDFREGHVDHWYLACAKCGVRHPHTAVRSAEPRAELATAWNTRPAASPITDDAREAIAQIIDPSAWKIDSDGYRIEQVHSGRARETAAKVLAYLAALPLAPREGWQEEVAIPRDIAEQVLSMGRAEWGATEPRDQAGHLEHLAESLRLTREHFNFEDVPVPMHGLYLEGLETVLCHTGTSPNSGANAQALTSAWNWLHDQCAALSRTGEVSRGLR